MKYLAIAVILIMAVIPSASGTHDPNDFFALEVAFPAVVWSDIHGTSSTNVFAVGTSNLVDSAIAYRGSGSWALQTVPDIDGLRSVWVFSNTLAIATSTAPNNKFLQWDGATWAEKTGPAAVSRFFDVWGVSATQIVFQCEVQSPSVGFNACTVTYNGSTFGSVNTCFDQVADIGRGIFGVNGVTSGGRGLTTTAGSGNTIIGTTGDFTTGLGFCEDITNLESAAMHDVWGASTASNSMVAVGNSGRMVIADTPPVPILSPTQGQLTSIWGTSSSNIWAVGSGGLIIHGTSVTTWTLEPSLPPAQNLVGVYFSDASNGWVVSTTGNIYKLQVNTAVALPVLTGLQWDPGDMIVHADDACLGDEVELTINVEPSLGAGGITWYIINSETNVVVESGTSAQFFALANKHFHTSRPYPTGEYTFVVTADVTGLLAPDNWAGQGFNVDTGSCFTAVDAQLIQNRFDTVDRNLAYVNNTVLQLGQDLSYTNETVNSIRAQQVNIFTRLNTTCQKTTDTDCEGIKADLTAHHNNMTDHHFHQDGIHPCNEGQCNITVNVNNTDVITAMHNADSQIGLTIYALIWLALIAAIIVWAEIKREVFLYVLAIIAGMTFVLLLWDEILALRVVVIAAMALVAYRGYIAYDDEKAKDD